MNYLTMQSRLLSSLQVAASSTLFTTTRIKELLVDANQWATTSYLWVQLERAKTTNTIANHYYYDYPADFRTDTITRLIIDGVKYEQKNFDDFLDYKLNNPNDVSTFIFSDYARQWFVFPTPTVTGSTNVDIWGHIQAPDPSADADLTIFAGSEEMANEAIIKRAKGVALENIDGKMSATLKGEAEQMLAKVYQKVLAKQSKYQRLDHPMFKVPDFVGGKGAVKPGNFSYRP